MTTTTESKTATPKYTCCDNPRIIVSESFSYEAFIDDHGVLIVDTNDYCTDGYNDIECANCGHEFNNDDFNDIENGN